MGLIYVDINLRHNKNPSAFLKRSFSLLIYRLGLFYVLKCFQKLMQFENKLVCCFAQQGLTLFTFCLFCLAQKLKRLQLKEKQMYLGASPLFLGQMIQYCFWFVNKINSYFYTNITYHLIQQYENGMPYIFRLEMAKHKTEIVDDFYCYFWCLQELRTKNCLPERFKNKLVNLFDARQQPSSCKIVTFESTVIQPLTRS